MPDAADQNVITTRLPGPRGEIMCRRAGALRRAGVALAGIPRPQPAEAGLIVCPWFRIGGSIVRTIALTASFDHAADVTLDELRAELIYPSTSRPIASSAATMAEARAAEHGVCTAR